MIFRLALVLAILPLAQILSAQAPYKTPTDDVVRMVNAKPTPIVSISPNKEWMLLTDYNPNPNIAVLSDPFLKLAGLRISPSLNARQRITEFTGMTLLNIGDGKKVNIECPKDGRLNASAWSPDGKKLAFLVDYPTGVQLFVADVQTGKSRKLGNVNLNDILGTPMQWMKDNEHILVKIIAPNRGNPPFISNTPTGPVTEETAGKVSQVMTYQDLLRNENDARLFEYYAQSQIAVIRVSDAYLTTIGQPALYTSLSLSPDQQFLLVSTLIRPFSYRVQYNNFARKTEVWDKTGKILRTIASFPITDEIPRQGVVTGPRDINWQPLYGARLLWTEALDGGDPLKKVPFRDKVMSLDPPFSTEPKEVMKTIHRNAGYDWLNNQDAVLLTEYNRDRRWTTTYLTNLQTPTIKDTLFDLSINDDYNAPGNPVYTLNKAGENVLMQDSNYIYFASEGASPKGNLPRLDRYNIKSKEKTQVFLCPENAYEEFVSFAGSSSDRFITRYQNKTTPPNYLLKFIDTPTQRPLTNFKDPAPQLTGIEKRLVTYSRKDGVPLSGTLYLPLNYKPGQRVPLFIWAYPLEYSDPTTAGQVRGSQNKFTYYRNDSPLFFVTQGYAVLMDATMPVVGDPETMNNTFITQITSSGRAAIDYLDSLGIINPNQVGVGGHSYGAFMTANLLAHSDDYAFGIARSGAYNRSLTPFGFQSERRSFWEAKEIYNNLSPFNFADKINEPLLLIHGEADNNPGTHTIQSERLYQAIKGNGGISRLVLLPCESHGYRASQSILHVLAEMFDWAKKYGTKTNNPKAGK